MAQRYHLGDDGQPRECKAHYKCPKGADIPHFTGGIKDARAWAEEQNAQEAGGSFGVNKATSDEKFPESYRKTAEDALKISEPKLEDAKKDLIENRESLKIAEDRLDDEESNVDRLLAQGAEEEEVTDAEDEAYMVRVSIEEYKEDIDDNLREIDEAESDIELAKNVIKGSSQENSGNSREQTNRNIEAAFRDNELGSGIHVGSDGTVTTDSPDTPVETTGDGFLIADTDGNILDYESDWEPVEGLSGQQGYDGPIMHPSETIGGGALDRIRENPGTYVALPAETLEEDDDDELDSSDEPVGWVLMKKKEEETEPDYDTLYKVDDRVKNLASIQRSAVDSFSDDHDFDKDVATFATDAAAEAEDFAFEEEDYDDVIYTAHDTYDAQRQAGVSKKESMKSAVTAATQKAHDLNEGYADYYKENPEVSNGIPDRETDYYQGHPNKDSWTVSAEALDNDERTYKESLKIAEDKNSTGKDLRNLVERREQQDLRLAQNLEDVDLDNVDWDEKLKDIRESHEL